MEALVQFYLDMSPFKLADQDRCQFDEGFDSRRAKNDWVMENGKRICLPKAFGFIHWDKQIQAFFVQEGNGRKIVYSPEGFETPDYLPDPAEYPIQAVTATVYFESVAGIQNGEYEERIEGSNHAVKAVLSIETLKDGVVRHRLHIDRCPSLAVLSQIASRIRSGVATPKVVWP